MMTMFLPSFSGRRADVDRRRDRRARGNADRNAFEPRDQPRRVEGGLIADRDDLVDQAAVENGRHEAGADALNLVRPGRAARQHRRIFRLDRDHLARSACAAFSTWPTPVIVPPVPTPETTMSTSPCVSFQISSAVVRR